MQTQHTPGPWHSVQPTFDREIMQAYFYICNDIEAKTIMDKYEHEANARLMAAAPNLLEACESYLKANDFHNVTLSDLSSEEIDLYNKISLAVSKAKGEI